MKFGRLVVSSPAVPLALIAAIGMTLYVHRVLTPFEREQDILHGVPGNHLGDICQRWIGTRELVLHNRDPYSIEITREIQTAYYGHPLSPQEHRDEKRFAYPIFVVFLLAPTIWMPFSIVQHIAVLILAIATAASVPLWLRFLGWELAPAQLATATILVLASPAAVQGLRLQQFSLLVAFLIAASAALVIRGRLFWAGSLLVMATIRPQMAALAIAWWFFWAAIRWKERNRLILGFAATMLLLIGAGEIVLPGWIGRFYEGVVAYRQYSESRSMLELCAGTTFGVILNWLALFGTAIFCWQNREQPSRALSMALVTTILALPIRATAVSNQILEIPGILLVLSSWRGSQSNNLFRGIVVALLAIIGWPWLSSITLLLVHAPAKLPFFASYGVSLLLPAALMQKARGDQTTQMATAATQSVIPTLLSAP